MFDISKVNRAVELFIFDSIIAIVKIKKVTSKFDKSQDLLHSFTDWDSVIREFQIIGEASKYLLKNDLIDGEYQKVVDFRNQITHEYFGIDEDIVWTIIHKDLDSFEEIIISLMGDIKPDLKQELIESFIEDNKYLDFVVEELENLRVFDEKQLSLSPDPSVLKLMYNNTRIRINRRNIL